jgi:MFS family permease
MSDDTPPAADARTRWGRYGVLATLYFAQGLPFGFFVLAVPVLLRTRGYDLKSVAGSSLLLLPWGLKFLWAPLVDRYGTKRAWILPMQLVNLAVLAALATRATDDLLALALGMFLVAAASATQDIATDGLAVALLPESERGTGNGIQVGAYRIGMVVGGGLIPFVYEGWGPRTAFLLLAGLVGLTTLPVLPLREGPRPVAERTAVFDPKILTPWFSRAALPWIATLFLYKAGDAMATPLVKPMLVDQGWSMSEIGALTGLAGSSVAALASAVGGPVVGVLSRPRALLAFGLLQAAAQVSFAWLDPVAVVVVEHFVGTFATIALFTAMMDRCRRPGREASDYTLQASLVVFFTGLVGAVGGALADALGYAPFFALCGVVSVAGAVLAATRSPDEPRLA